MNLELYQHLLDYLSFHKIPSTFTLQQKQSLVRQAIHYFEKNGILFKKNKKNPDQYLRVITLLNRDKVLYNLHSSPLSGHFGIKKTVAKAMKHYYWPTMGKYIKNYIETCDVCQISVGKPGRFQMTKPIKATSPFVHIGIDFVGPLKITSQGNHWIIVATDYFTKWPEAKAVPAATAKKTSEFLYENIICQHGVPTIIQSDRGSSFLNHTISLLKEEIGFHHHLSAPYHPQTNRLVERFNRTLCKMIKKFVLENYGEWDQIISSVIMAYRTYKHEATKYTPFYLLYGREAQMPIDIEFASKFSPIEEPYEQALERRISSILGTFKDAMIIAERSIESAQERMKIQQNKLQQAYKFKIEDIVLVYDASKQNVHGDKFSS
ncbi:13784_t:CDS:1 [Cetraspora pellucida]|uniref:13784_t:CDS:1 n=1 Tax=Cetraspora pellucida TaxID=1433469 RepID=A0ACA9QK00_9GLOM|nr:13784_t:CDS:1 [Cetraspora pellucida]